MASRAELELVRRALNRLSQQATADLDAALAGLDRSERVLVRRALAGAYPDIVAEYGRAAAALGADMAESWASELGLRPQVSLADGLSPARAMGAVDWALGRADPVAAIATLTDEFVKQPYRETMQWSAWKSGAAWARVPMGAKTCAFCLMTCSRGAVYASSRSAGSDHKYHGGCDCAVTMVRTADDYPDGYDPNGLYDVYLQARQNAGASGTSTLAEIRKITGGH